MIILDHVTAQYPVSDTPVVHDFSLTVEKGTLTILLGGSGTGKTTIFRLLSGEMMPTAGRVHVAEIAVSELRGSALARYRQSIGLLSQDLPLLEDRTIGDNLLLPLELAGVSTVRRQERMASVLERFGLRDDRDISPREISMGERQRACIARAVVTEPLVLLADEPAAHLDAKAAAEIAEHMKRENLRGMTIVLGTQDESFAKLFPAAVVVRL